MKRLLFVLAALVLVLAGYLYHLQYKFGIQIPKVNPVTGDTCGVVIYHNTILNFSNWNPYGLADVHDSNTILEQYGIGSALSAGYEYLSGYCSIKTGDVFYSGEFMHSLPQKPRYRLPFVLP